MTEDILADFINKLNDLASDYGLVVGVKTIGEDGEDK